MKKTLMILLAALLLTGFITAEDADSKPAKRRNLVLTSKNTLNEDSRSHLGMTAFDDKLFIAWTGINDVSNINVAYSKDGFNFERKHRMTLSEASTAAPYLTVYKDELCLLWSDGGTKKINLMYSPHTPDQKKITFNKNETSNTVCGVPYDDYFAIFWRGEDRDHRINMVLSGDGLQFKEVSKTILPNDSTAYHVGGASFKDRLVVAFAGVDRDRRINIRYSDDNGKTWKKGHRLEEFTKSGPYLITHKGLVIMSFVGHNGSPNIMYSKDGIQFVHKKVFPQEETNHTPALAVFRGKVYMAWLGINGKINVARVDGF